MSFRARTELRNLQKPTSFKSNKVVFCLDGLFCCSPTRTHKICQCKHLWFLPKWGELIFAYAVISFLKCELQHHCQLVSLASLLVKKSVFYFSVVSLYRTCFWCLLPNSVLCKGSMLLNFPFFIPLRVTVVENRGRVGCWSTSVVLVKQ